jgi:hypothetical protein
MDLAEGAQMFQIIARHLRDAGETGLRRELNGAIRDAAAPIADVISSSSHLREYMPNRYAEVLKTDLRVTVSARAGGTSPGVTILVRAPTTGRGGRKVRQREAGVITHPLFGDKEHWYAQTGGMVPRFGADPVDRGGPQARDKVLEAMRHTVDEITKR